MPVGIITNVSATVVGSVVGCLMGGRLSERWKTALNNVLGVAALFMGIVLIVKVHALPPVALSLILGAIIGELCRLEQRIGSGIGRLAKKLAGGGESSGPAFMAQVSAAVIIFCCGGTGWFGALNEGLTGDGSILITKAVLDCVTACIFATILGRLALFFGGLQLGVYLILYFLSGLVAPYITPEMIADFSSVGGIVTLVAGLRLSGIKRDIDALNLLPGLILSFFLSALWTLLMG